MNEYKWDEINLQNDYSASFKTTITEAMMDSFKTISGDDNPLHTDTDFAIRGGIRAE